jgi:hypothetical protein
MNKAFVREPDQTAEHCPRCGSLGQPVGRETLEAQLEPHARSQLAEFAAFCPFPQCEVAYFDQFERVVLVADLPRPVWPKDPDAPLCGCFGLTRDDIEQDIAEGVVTRVKALLARAQSAEARCSLRAANGQSCVPEVQRYYMKCRGGM